MEKIKVNMTPCEDVQTIHASQNDGEARQWEFELHNNGELIDTSDVKEQLVFKAYKGGTEQLLPENGSTPTTSPFKGDIRYPQGLLTDQEFTYRQSPTEEDGLAKITDIKGNTIVWNQLHQNQNGKSETAQYSYMLNVGSNFRVPSGHKLLVFFTQPTGCEVYATGRAGITVTYQLFPPVTTPTVRSFTGITTSILEGALMNGTVCLNTAVSSAVQLTNCMVFDLTLMGLDITADQFRALFSLPYYQYDSGSLLSFNGNGIKTVGKNLLDANIGIPYGGGSGMRWYESQGFMLMANKTYTFSASNTNGASVAVYIIDHATRTTLASSTLVTTYTPTQNVIVYLQAYRGSGIPSGTEFQLEFGTSATEYEPYTSSTLSLPISTYFPNGMDGVGDAYDELSNSGYVKRMTRVTFDGSESWYQGNPSQRFYLEGAITDFKNGSVGIANNGWEVTTNGTDAISGNNKILFQIIGSTYRVNAYANTLGLANAQAFKTYLASNPITVSYELATPTETSFTTASLVTENGEVALANENGVLTGKCNSDVSADAGFIEGKIKLSDADGECYSNKIQLHIERSPQ